MLVVLEPPQLSGYMQGEGLGEASEAFSPVFLTPCGPSWPPWPHDESSGAKSSSFPQGCRVPGVSNYDLSPDLVVKGSNRTAPDSWAIYMRNSSDYALGIVHG